MDAAGPTRVSYHGWKVTVFPHAQGWQAEVVYQHRWFFGRERSPDAAIDLLGQILLEAHLLPKPEDDDGRV